VPYNVLWVVARALRPDAIASLHDPRAEAAAPDAELPPLGALLPGIPGLTPSIDRLAARGAAFPHGWSAAVGDAGLRSMLSGALPSELPPDQAVRDGATAHGAPAGGAPAALPLALRRGGAVTAAFWGDALTASRAAEMRAMGFDLSGEPPRASAPADVAGRAAAWLDVHAHDRFFLLVGLPSPRGRAEAPEEVLARVPPPPEGPWAAGARASLARAAQDDEAIGVLLRALDAHGLAESTLVVVTADHGAALSAHHAGPAAGGTAGRRDRNGNSAEAARVPLVMALPVLVDGGRTIADRVRTQDIAPTLLDIEGLDPDPRVSGRSLLPLVHGVADRAPRVVVTEGDGSRAILWDRWRLVVHEPAGSGRTRSDLYDLGDDPGERRNVAPSHPDLVAEMRARLRAALANAPTADDATGPADALPVVHLRFAGAGRVHRVSGAVGAGDGTYRVDVRAEGAGVPPESLRCDGSRVDFAFTTATDALVGLDVRTDPPGAPIAWELFLDDAPWPEGATFAGPFGLPATVCRGGIDGDGARAEADAARPPLVSPTRDLGVFVTRERPKRLAPRASRD
jgi:hypothetical protein